MTSPTGTPRGQRASHSFQVVQSQLPSFPLGVPVCELLGGPVRERGEERVGEPVQQVGQDGWSEACDKRRGEDGCVEGSRG